MSAVDVALGVLMAILYLGLVATVLAYTLWARLLCRGALSSAIVFGERKLSARPTRRCAAKFGAGE